MDIIVRLTLKVIEITKFQRINMSYHHWRSYIGHLEGKSGLESRFYYLGLNFILNAYGLLLSSICIIGSFKEYRWLQDPWYATVMFINFFPTEIRNTATVVWFFYNLGTVLGVGYELGRKERAPSFMRIYTPRGQAALGKDGDRNKFQRFQQYCMLMAYVSTYSYNFFMLVTVIIYGYAECYSVNPTFYFFWVVYFIFQTSSGAYTFVAVPFLLFMSTYYLRLLQQILLTGTKMLMNKRTKKRKVLITKYQQIVPRYVSTNRLLSEFNQFWSFYLYLWMQIYPVMITYLIYALIHNNIQSKVWADLYLFTIIGYTNNLLLVVYACSKTSLTRHLRRHLHLQGAVDHVRLTKYFLRSISNQILDNKTYFVLFFKFAFIYMKLTNLANENKS